MSKKKGGILSLIPLALVLIAMGGGLFWLIAGLIMFLCGVEINPILWIISGVAAFIGIIGFVIITLINKKNKTE